MERQLATVRIISDILPIENADFIELAKIDGWQCVVKKGEFKVGDKCIYFEIDSLLPVIEQFSFLPKSSIKTMDNGNVGYRIKTIRLKKELSQGLALSLNLFDIDSNIEVETDLTEQLNINKYEKPIPVSMSGRAKGNFPIFIPKTDASRIQNLGRLFREHKHKKTKFNVSEKIEGASATFYINNNEFGVCSRNYDLEFEENNIFWKIALQYNIEEKLREYSEGRNISVQGELIGEGVQGNYYNIKGHDLYLFNFFDIDKQEYSLEELYKFSIYSDIKVVPFVEIVSLDEFEDIDSILDYSIGKSTLNDDVEREGIVFITDDKKITFKAINNNFLLKEK